VLTEILPTLWGSVTFEELLEGGHVTIQNGFACGKNNQIGKGVPQLRPMNINSKGQISLESLKFCEFENDVQRYLLKAGDIIFNNTNSAELVGKTAVWENSSGNFVLSNHMTIIRLNDKSGLYSPFLAKYLHYLWSMRYFEHVCTNHINQSSVGIDRLKSIDIPTPPLGTQHKIVAIFEKAEATQRLRTEADALMQRLVQSLFLEMFGDPVMNSMGWDSTRLKDLGGWTSGGTPCRSKPEYFQGSIPWYTTGELNDSYLIDSIENFEQPLHPKYFIISDRPLPHEHVHQFFHSPRI